MTGVQTCALPISDLNDDIKEIGDIAQWLSSIDKNIPLHLSRYFPSYELINGPTSISTLKTAKDEANKCLNYVYIGNIPGYDNTTYCPNCRKPVIERGNMIFMTGLNNGMCKYCGEKIYVICET